MDNGASSYRRFLEGDENALGEIMEEYFFPLVFFVNRYVRDVHAAEDISMDVISDLLVRKRYNGKAKFKTYLFMMGKSRALNHLKKARRTGTAELSEADGAYDGEDELIARAAADERRRAVNAALDKLPRDMRAAVHLIYFEDLTYDEAARVMGKSRKQVDNLLYRAKKELRVILGEEGRKLL
ncbi:MAG: RNA polymerase sigma factor [Clostridia bacterium]|nr:RNA polymerase sigma factor [Clostridia bacterium]